MIFMKRKSISRRKFIAMTSLGVTGACVGHYASAQFYLPLPVRELADSNLELLKQNQG
jgi:hypothetical protein